MKREFDAKVWKTGNAHVITIPASIIKKYKIKKGGDLVVIIKIKDE